MRKVFSGLVCAAFFFVPAGPFRGQLLVRLNVAMGGPYDYSVEVNCEP